MAITYKKEQLKRRKAQKIKSIMWRIGYAALVILLFLALAEPLISKIIKEFWGG